MKYLPLIPKPYGLLGSGSLLLSDEAFGQSISIVERWRVYPDGSAEMTDSLGRVVYRSICPFVLWPHLYLEVMFCPKSPSGRDKRPEKIAAVLRATLGQEPSQ